ncbi:C6 finger domain [Mycena sanguinolenta]|uniref:C6 finger domain n=1 Tax=Mycena sanguinolenta TaxID=230812 RepID=A0A8H6ZEC5_9AGAR|nr:C6 finger domain [Mycena sanguinolenta]
MRKKNYKCRIHLRQAPANMPESLLPKRRRTYVACLACRKRKIKCFTDGSEKKACRRCSQKGLQCQYRPVSDEQKLALLEKSQHWPFPQHIPIPTPSSGYYAATRNHWPTHSGVGAQQDHNECGSYPAKPAIEAGSLYSPLQIRTYAPVLQQASLSRSPPNYGYRTDWS